jgi:predicted Zn-dependent protease
MAISWTIDQLKSELSKRKEVKDWIVTTEHVHRRERYFMTEGKHLITDQDRNVRSRSINLRIFVNLSEPGRHGETTKKLFPSLPLKNQIDTAIEAALQTNHQSWNLPTVVPNQVPVLATTDPKMAEDLDRVMLELSERVKNSVEQKRSTVFNSAELFLSIHDRELYLSNGLTHRSSQSRIYTEAAFSYSRPGPGQTTHSDEYLCTHWAVHLDHLPIEKLFDEASSGAEHSLDITKPMTGKYSVIVNSEVLSTLINGYLTQLSAAHSYNDLPFIQPGAPFIADACGDLLSITLDPSLDFGANTTSLSEQGLIQAPLLLVKDNCVLKTMTDKQYGDYLGIEPTTVRGNVIVEAGQMTHEELTKEAPIVIEVLQFSGLFADPNSGTFSSEIRLAKLYDNQRKKVTYIKGGSLSGSITENFRKLRLSKSIVHKAHFSTDSQHGEGYLGPEYALLNEVSIVG